MVSLDDDWAFARESRTNTYRWHAFNTDTICSGTCRELGGRGEAIAAKTYVLSYLIPTFHLQLGYHLMLIDKRNCRKTLRSRVLSTKIN